MNILVIEDKEIHRQSAKETLSGHNVTIVDSFDKAMALMDPQTDEDNVQRLLVEAGFPTEPEFEDKDRWRAFWNARDEARAKSRIPFPFEVVLTDMMLPMSKKTLTPDAFNPNEQVPYGFIIALKATLCGAKFVAMVTDTNHHKGALSAALDNLGPSYWHTNSMARGEGLPKRFIINGAQAIFVHSPFVGKIICGDDPHTGPKDWGKVLAHLVTST